MQRTSSPLLAHPLPQQCASYSSAPLSSGRHKRHVARGGGRQKVVKNFRAAPLFPAALGHACWAPQGPWEGSRAAGSSRATVPYQSASLPQGFPSLMGMTWHSWQGSRRCRTPPKPPSDAHPEPAPALRGTAALTAAPLHHRGSVG